jgi:dipeptidyl aminopeptidase/acylaminoacyl peptidase
MRHRLLVIALGLALALPATSTTFAQQKRALTVDDIFAFKNVSDPQISPDGRWVAYTVSQMDQKKDSSDTDIYMVPLTGGDAVRVTTSERPETTPRWSPDNRYLAFLSGRDTADGFQGRRVVFRLVA